MNRTPRRNKYSVDGFVPSTGQRRIGFEQSRPLNAQDVRRVRRRPPQNSIVSGPAIKGANSGAASAQPGKARNNYPEFTSYAGTNAAPQPPAAGGRGGRRSTKAARPSFWRRHRWGRIIKRTFAVFGIILLLGGGWLGWKLVHTSSKVLGNSNLIDFLSSTKLKGEDQGRVNILMGGVSTDDPGHEGANLTDSIMIMSLDTKNHKAFLLSVPRDLWVNIPGYGHSKINAANAYGDQDKFTDPNYPDGGMGLLEKTLSEQLQLPINYYVKVDYSALKDAVNAVGGIQVTIQSDDKRGLYDPNISPVDHGPLRLPNGTQTLDGQTALNLARARGDPCNCGHVEYGFAHSDFDRTQHQRQELIALKSKITSPGVITNPLKIGQLFDTVSAHVKSNFKPSEIHRLYDISKETSNNNIQSLSFNDADGKNLLSNYNTPDGASALIPAAGIDNYSQIQLYLNKLLSNNQTAKETASVVVLNAGEITGLASKEGNILTSKGMSVIAVGDAPMQGVNTIIDQSNGKKPNTKATLTKLFGSNISTTPNPTYPSADFIIILGTQQTAPAGTSESDSSTN